METPSFLLAFAAGLVSFLTPCCLPIYPSFLSYVTGVSINDLEQSTKQTRARILAHSIAFFVGFSTIYVALGLGASALGVFFKEGRHWFRLGAFPIGLHTLGGLFVVLMGLTMLGVIKLPFLLREHRLQLANRPSGLLGSAVIGMTYAAGWTPCVGPILGGVIYLAGSNPAAAVPLLLAYSVGFAVPFIGLAYGLGAVPKLTRYTGVIERVGGAFMVLTGLMIASGYMERLSAWLLRIIPFTGI
ncbi:MAG TPA: cytochrome c biogenesis protein CcdA [Symbiobacteriaceae bacterium]|nr:cytochrome c biogenesis protein CcdA [Symbiobacteriaceae bacterium]